MLKLSVATIAACAALTAACGGSPTAPQPIVVQNGANGTGVVNDPAAPSGNPAPPTAPGPAVPNPPSPAPGPLPAPAPPTDTVETWHAHVDVQRASSPEVALPASFTVTVRGDQMMFGPLQVTILARDGTHIYARRGTGLTIQIDDNAWTVTSVDVFATGTMAYTNP